MTELISVAKYNSDDRPHTERVEGKEDQRQVKVKPRRKALSTTHENMYKTITTMHHPE